MSRSAFDEIMASLDAPMAVVTASFEGEDAGCLVGFHSQSSIEPQRGALWMSKANHTTRVALHVDHLGVHFLTADDRDLAEVFGTLTGDEVDKLALVEHHPGTAGVPLLDRCPNRLVVRRTALLDEGGDHLCIVTEPIEAHSSGSFRPLRLSDVSDLTAGHAAAEGASDA